MEGDIWCLDPKHATLPCTGTSVLSRTGTADQLIKQVCQLVKIPANPPLPVFKNSIPTPLIKKLPTGAEEIVQL